jgi:AcrR family transcriptional regulator
MRRASQERRAQQKEDLRRAILHAAGELFLKHGYEDFSLRQVAEYLGYSPTTIYLYFENKDALLFELMDDAYQTFRDAEARAFSSTEDPLQRLIAIGRAYVDFGLTHPTAYKLMFFQRVDYLMGCFAGETEPRIDAIKASQYAVQLAMEAGAIRPGDPAVIFGVVWSAVHGLVMMALTMPEFDRATTNKVMESLFQTLMVGLITPPSA